MNRLLHNLNLFYRLRGLHKAAAVLHIGAHPDDEDSGLITYVTRKIGGRAVYWSATRGEGGQNRVGPYQGEALGLYRTWEAEKARFIDGGECLYGPFYDFGFSKNPEEVMQKWNRFLLVKEIVRAIRIVQPQIVVARWQGVSEDFHGQHQAVGLAASEAFEAAGDPNQFPELAAQNLAAWKAFKFYQSVNNSGGDQTVGGALNIYGHLRPDYENSIHNLCRLNTGEYDPIAGITYQERAWLAINNHQTQAIGLAPAPRDFFYYFILRKSFVPVSAQEVDMYEGLNTSLTSLVEYPGEGAAFLADKLETTNTQVNEAIERFHLEDTSRAVPPLLASLNILRALRGQLTRENFDFHSFKALDNYLARKTIDFEEVIAQCLGLRLECIIDKARVVPGQELQISSHLWNHRHINIHRITCTHQVPVDWEITEIPNTLPEHPSYFSIQSQVVVSKQAEFTCPDWLNKPRNGYVYQMGDEYLTVSSPVASLVSSECQIDLGQSSITLKAPALLREPFAGGYRELTLKVIPPISLHPAQKQELLLVKSTEQQLDLTVVVKINAVHTGTEGKLRIETSRDWRIEPQVVSLSLDKAGVTRTVRFTVTIPAHAQAGYYPLRYVICVNERDYNVTLQPVRMAHPGIPNIPDESNCSKEQYLISPAEVSIRLLDVQFVQNLKYAYVKGTAEEIVETLTKFNLDFHLITDTEMGHIDLNQFDAVFIGTNAYIVRDELQRNAGRFLDYVKQGGTLVVQYQNYNYEGKGYTPYPFHYNQPHDRVTFEEEPSPEFLKPDHALLNYPNVINHADFYGWEQDVGLYFFGQWDKRYEPIIACHDPGEHPKQGGMLITSYGQGNYLYTGYTFFRQLPQGIPGAFRLFANILALPVANILKRAELLSKSHLFACINEEQLHTIARIVSESWLEAGEYLCRKGEQGNEMYIIVQGEIHVLEELENGEKLIGTSKAGECIGELAVLSNIPRSMSLRAVEHVHLLVIKGEQFRALMHRYTELSDRIIQVLVNRLVKIA